MQTSRVKWSVVVAICLMVMAGLAAGAMFVTRDTATSGGTDATGAAAGAADRTTGPSGLPVPRFVSLKTDRVNVRRGPSTAHQVIWVYARKGLPVEIIAESEHWRRVRDSDGEEGWVYHSLLAGRRTGLIAPWRKGEKVKLQDGPEETSGTIALVQTGVVGDVLACTGTWCEFRVAGYTGWLKQELVWGVYPSEAID
ncbi:MAG: SH3 domain-containing protein [Hyphomicrobiales bacterium]